MRSEYFGSAKITYLDKDAIWAALRKFAKRLAREHPEVLRVAVFGSLARDEAVPGSDADVLIVLLKSGLAFVDRPASYRPSRFPICVDIFAYTREEIESMLSEGNVFLKRALAEGVTLFEREP